MTLFSKIFLKLFLTLLPSSVDFKRKREYNFRHKANKCSYLENQKGCSNGKNEY